MNDSLRVLENVERVTAKPQSYFQLQWERQRQMQLLVIENESELEIKTHVEDLVTLEDQLSEAQQDYLEMQQARRRNLTSSQIMRLEQAPDTIAFLQEEINQVINKLDPETNTLMKLVVRKSKLYEAKVGVMELQRRWDQRSSGARVQERFKKQMNAKMRVFKNKWTSYYTRATNYNSIYSPQIEVPTPTFEDVRSYNVENPFWNIGSLEHPKEPWANDSNTQKGIQANLTITHCHDELRRIAREVRQAIKWSMELLLKLTSILDHLDIRINGTDVPTRPQQHICHILTSQNLPIVVLKSVVSNFAKRPCRLWISWNAHCVELLKWSQKWINPDHPEFNLEQQWKEVVAKSYDLWEKMTGDQSVIMDAAPEDEPSGQDNESVNEDGDTYEDIM
ncbi:hypothetical protein PGT21_005026 [Puccinia graminis f. sp. tritici]|uniref:Uncharacterized protein n=1 Tax=Puccinia graminis f. sp. tritici TaxID=56615 RepID=A0A5B0QHJ8_PUCGR|nr:hypothetical protein PGT21_005026 [Puccinia graminis f. sp. tritici]